MKGLLFLWFRFLLLFHGSIRREHFRNATLCCLLGCFKLVTDGNSLTGTDELGQIAVEGMVRKTCHSERLALFILCLGALGERNAKNLGCFLCILLVGLIEVTSTEQQKCIGMFALQVQELFEHRTESNLWWLPPWLSLPASPFPSALENFCASPLPVSCW